ncbi:HNH endonuclease [Streptomyces echinatus]|uniref:Transposase-like protein n=1 Tax=Streptomyces echinatus TaxID=67293 RepID=A0A7W9Q3Y6_9ACTN|nr:HNH endonuclease [Streptomyces echinatus]MBB5932367.1 transposase-like protein [Streptomyces echinatus]
MARLTPEAYEALQGQLLNAANDTQFVSRFWARVQKSENCWLWTGGKAGQYGQLTLQRRRLLAHRVSWVITNRKVLPQVAVIRHRCDTPLCVRPDHLEAGSVAQNVRDVYERRRRTPKTWPQGAGRPNAVLDDETVAQMRRAVRSGRSIRSLALEIGVDYTSAHRAVRGIGWTHVTEPPVPKARIYPPHRANFVRNNPDVVAQARELRDSGLNLRQIADRLGISRAAAFRCCRTESNERTS